MRIGGFLGVLGALLGGAGLSLGGAYLSVGVLQNSSEIGVRQALDADGLTWAEVEADGLRVILTGDAPSEALRFQAMTAAGSVVDAARVIDEITVNLAEALQAPRFSIEILRNDSGISLIGLVPASTDRAKLVDRFARAAGGVPVADLLESSNFAAPDGWARALTFAIETTADLPRSKISMAADSIEVTAITDSAEEKDQVEAALSRTVPEGLSLGMQITAPRPVIAPFTLRFIMDSEGARFDTCAADDEAARDRILKAAWDAGAEGELDCTIGLGVPSPSWGEAAEQAIRAMAWIGQGSVTLSDGDIHLAAAEGTDQATFDHVVGELENTLPELFSLTADLPVVAEEVAAAGPREFTATLSPEGLVQIRGRLPNDLNRDAVHSVAKALFSADKTHMAARLDETLPPGWSIRAMIALDALSQLHNGSVRMEPDLLIVRGRTGDTDARDRIARLLSEKLDGGRYELDVTYVESLDPSTLIPTPEECVADIQAVIAARKITFEPSSAKLNADAKDTMDQIAEILDLCGPIRLEVQGHTDSQGREVMNQALSQSRAEAVIQELMNRRVLVSNITAKGYGESQPIADNDTEEGREANRRIEFRLVQPKPIGADAPETDAPETDATADDAAPQEETPNE
jgi:OOP family OmpA-OmpF porin